MVIEEQCCVEARREGQSVQSGKVENNLVPPTEEMDPCRSLSHDTRKPLQLTSTVLEHNERGLCTGS
jgi:hypothetical protein